MHYYSLELEGGFSMWGFLLLKLVQITLWRSQCKIRRVGEHSTRAELATNEINLFCHNIQRIQMLRAMYGLTRSIELGAGGQEHNAEEKYCLPLWNKKGKKILVDHSLLKWSESYMGRASVKMSYCAKYSASIWWPFWFLGTDTGINIASTCDDFAFAQTW